MSLKRIRFLWPDGAARIVAILLVSLLFACTPIEPKPSGSRPPTPSKTEWTDVLNVGTAIMDGWRHLPLRGSTSYEIVAMDGTLVLRAEGRNSASGLLRRVEIDPEECPHLEWSWRVDAMQAQADLEVKEREDVAASIMLLFGDPGFLSNPDPVPTVRYVWTNEATPKGRIVDSPYFPGVVRSIVLESGMGSVQTWKIERRDIRRDFEAAFGRAPDDSVHAVVLFTDNDQTKQKVVAYYGWIRSLCRAPADG